MQEQGKSGQWGPDPSRSPSQTRRTQQVELGGGPRPLAPSHLPRPESPAVAATAFQYVWLRLPPPSERSGDSSLGDVLWPAAGSDGHLDCRCGHADRRLGGDLLAPAYQQVSGGPDGVLDGGKGEPELSEPSLG